MDITEELEEERRICDAATAGPWEWQQRTMGDELTKPTLLGDPNDPDPLRRAMAYGHPWNILKTTGDWRPTEEDATFIAHARTVLPQRNAALRDVLGLHCRGVYGECVECAPGTPYPCSTVRAIEEAGA